MRWVEIVYTVTDMGQVGHIFLIGQICAGLSNPLIGYVRPTRTRTHAHTRVT